MLNENIYVFNFKNFSLVAYICFVPMLNKLITLFFFTPLCFFAKAQEDIRTINIPGEWLTIKDGLSQGLVSSIIQDKEGYMWFATKDGLNKYDGYHISVLRNNLGDKYSLPDNYVTQLLEDDNGNFWVGTATKGLCLFDKKTERFFPVTTSSVSDTLENDAIRFIRVNKGKLFIQKSSDVLIYDISNLKPGNYTSIDSNEMKLLFSYNKEQVKEIYQYNIGRQFSFSWMPDFSIWANCLDTIFHYIPDAGLKHWVKESWSFSAFGIKEQNLNSLLFAPFLQHPEKLFVGYKNYLIQYDIAKKKIDFTKKLSETFQTGYFKMETLPDGSVFLFFNDESPYIYNPETGVIKKLIVNKGEEKMHYAFAPVCTDKNGISWFGTAGFGILKSDGMRQRFNAFTTTDNREALNYIADTYNLVITPEFKKKYNFAFGGLCTDKEGNIRIMTQQFANQKVTSFFCINPVTGQIKSYPFLSDRNIFRMSIFVDNKDEVWAFTDEGPDKKMLYHLNKTNQITGDPFRFPIKNDFNEYPFVSAWWQDAKGVLWCGTIQGLFSLDAAKQSWHQWKNIYGDSNSLNTDMVFSICADPQKPDKYLWIGTNGGGFCRFEFTTGKCIRYTEKDGLPNDVVYGILSDGTGNLWLSTNKGLSCFNPGNKSFRNFNEDDGLPGDEFNRYQYMKMKNGELMFGGVNGYVLFNPTQILQKQPEVPIVFTGLSISNKPVDWKKDSSILVAPIGYSQSIILHPGQSMFTISFASLEFRNNQKKFYKYRLDGFDKTWTQPSTKNEATYTNLNPGSYTFYVTGTNSDGVWNKKGISIQVIILPYWYQTYWFKGAVVLLVVAGLYLLYRFRLQQLLKMQTLRNRIASDLHDEIGSTLSSISLYGAAAKKMVAGNEAVTSILSKINANTTEMMEAMSDIVWAINTRNDGFDNLANRMRNFAVQLAEAKNIELHFTENKNLPSMPLDMVQRKNMYLIFKEAVNNAIKYAGCKNLWVLFENQNHLLKMTVKDDGSGFSATDSAHSNKKSNLGGNGINNMKSRAAEIKGTLDIVSATGKGTEVILRVGLKNS